MLDLLHKALSSAQDIADEVRADLIIDRLITKGMAQRTKEDLKRTTQQILSALYSAYTSLPKDTTSVSISLTSGHYSGTLYSFRMVQRIYECLSDLKWIKSEKGSEYKKKITRMWASGELSLAFDELLFTWIPQKPKPKNALVVLRNFEHPESKTKKGRGKKTDLSVPETAEVNQYRSDLYRYNQFLLKHCISLRLDDENLNTLATEMINKPKEDRETWETEEERVNCLDIRRLQLRRIFSRGSLEQGGRFYGGWWQSLPEIHRPHITINGKTTIEIDFSTIALRILYAQQGIQVVLGRDLYGIGLEDWSGDGDPRSKLIAPYFIFITRARAQAETTSETITKAMIESRIAATRSVSICKTLRFRYQPMPPAPKKPTTVAALKATSQV